ncbi:MAG TPA: HD domain-containing protein [Acidimicrobiales bacterium]
MFTRMDAGTTEEWMAIREETLANQRRVADRILPMLRELRNHVDGYAVDQLTHSLQTATRAERAGADDELVVAALCHDLGKFVSTANHAAMSAEILRPYVRDELYHLILHHQTFQGAHYNHHFGWEADGREAFRGEPWFDLAATFADEWDQTSFDPDYDTLPLEHFEERLRAVFAEPRITK